MKCATLINKLILYIFEKTNILISYNSVRVTCKKTRGHEQNSLFFFICLLMSRFKIKFLGYVYQGMKFISFLSVSPIFLSVIVIVVVVVVEE
jgi:hypothetical protein